MRPWQRRQQKPWGNRSFCRYSRQAASVPNMASSSARFRGYSSIANTTTYRANWSQSNTYQREIIIFLVNSGGGILRAEGAGYEAGGLGAMVHGGHDFDDDARACGTCAGYHRWS